MSGLGLIALLAIWLAELAIFTVVWRRTYGGYWWDDPSIAACMGMMGMPVALMIAGLIVFSTGLVSL